MNGGPALPESPPALFPPRAGRERIDDWLTRALAAALDRVTVGSVTPTLDPAQLQRELAAFDFSSAQPLQSLLTWSIGQLEHGTVHMTHPRYFGLFNPAPNFPSQCADRIVSAFNPQLASSGSSPAPVEIEAHVIRALAARAGLPPESGGHFTTSGSEANFTSLLCALVRAQPRFVNIGVRAFESSPTVYASSECHAAWSKIVQQAGLGREALRLIGTDGQGRLSERELADALERDRIGGRLPILIVATAGTTGAGMIDPLHRCAQLSRDYGAWYHVDAAWGGAAVSSARLRPQLAGIERADSITIDAHKWFATTMACGLFITRHSQVLSDTFGVAADFMPSNASSLDPYLTTLQWSRRFMGLRLFLTLAAVGWEGVAAHVERAVALTDHARQRLVATGWKIANDSTLAVLCVVPPVGHPSPREIAARLLSSGLAWVNCTRFEGHDVIRICVTHGETTLEDVEQLVRALNRR